MIRLANPPAAALIYDAGNFNPSTASNQANFNSFTIVHNQGLYVSHVRFSNVSDGATIQYWYQVRSFGAPNGVQTFKGNLVENITPNAFTVRLYFSTSGQQNIKAYFFGAQ